jgi:hypothetical protein
VTSRLPVRSALSAPPTVLTVAAYGAAALALGYATVSAYWTAGGTALLSTVGGAVEDAARRGGGAAVLLGLAVTGMKLGGAGVALALVRPWGRRLPTRLLEGTALTGGLLLTGYGGLLVLVGAAALLGAFGPLPADPTALRWHVAVWDAWFLLWGALLTAAAVAHRRSRRRAAG